MPLLALSASSGASLSASASHTTPPPPPPEHQALYAELSQGLDAIEAQLDAGWDGGVGSGRLATGLSAANGNKSVGLLSATNWTRMIEMLDAFETMGVELVKVDVQYYFAYLIYGDPDLAGLSGIQLVTVAGQDAIPNIQTVTLTGAGERFEALLSAALDADGDGVPDSQDSGDTDGDSLADNVEFFCGSAASNAALRPERLDDVFSGLDDDGDTVVDEALPAGSAVYDCDGDGYAGAAEQAIFAGGGGRDQDACANNGWPSELASGTGSENRVTLADIGSFFAPVAYFSTNVGMNAGDERWDLVPGSVAGPDIGLQDVAALLAGATAVPPMLGGASAFNGPDCPWP